MVGLAGRVLDRVHDRGERPGIGLSESSRDHDVRVLEVLFEKVERLETRVSDAALSAHRPARTADDAPKFTGGEGI